MERGMGLVPKQESDIRKQLFSREYLFSKFRKNYSIFTSHINGRGHRIGAVCVFVCVSVRSNTLTIQRRNLKLGVMNLCNNGLEEFEGQRSRSPG